MNLEIAYNLIHKRNITLNKPDTCLVDGINHLKTLEHGNSCVQLFEMAYHNNMIPQRQYNEFGKDLMRASSYEEVSYIINHYENNF